MAVVSPISDESGQNLPARGRAELATALLLSILGFLVYNANLRLISVGDNFPARYLPFGILKYRTLYLDPIATITEQASARPYWVQTRYGHTFSSYPVAVPVLMTPLYLPAAAYLSWHGWTDVRLEWMARLMEKLSASLIASVSVAFVYLLLVRRARSRWAVWLALAYGFGTNTWVISSQALWQHGLAELLLVVALFMLLGPCSAGRSLVAGIILGLIPCVRPPDAILAAALGVFGMRWAKGRIWFLAGGAAVPLALLLTYNFRVAHHFAGGYGHLSDLSAFRYSLPRGVLGLLFSPARGLFIFSPFLLFLPVGLRAALREPRLRTLTLLLLLGVVAQVLLYAKLDWRAGHSWGPRFLTDMLPLLVWMLAAGVGSLGWVGRGVFGLTVGLSVGVQTVGAFWYTGTSNLALGPWPGDPNLVKAVWDVRHTPFLAELRHDPAPRNLMPDLLLLLKGGESPPVAHVPPPAAPGAPPRLDVLCNAARARLRGRQNAAGYWLTAFTPSVQFVRPAFEMNTFTTSMIVDLLSPVARAAGLDETLERARQHLRAQIEPGGLVRYHGRPDAPTIPALGRVITPDADDTALVWRICGPQGDARLPPALDVLKSYRTQDGLYRTWLAPREEYTCIDPGEDPNPADVGIQMHVLMFLAQVDRPAAEDLGRALQTAVGEDRLWVYYRKAPLLPLLREADLRGLGYPVCLPQDRLQTPVPGQEVWVRVCRLVARYAAQDGPRPSPAEAQELLASLGTDNFLAIRSNPPLFYHNDMTGKVRRFYWSEEFGFALWLRLYLESSADRPGATRETGDLVGVRGQ